MKFFGTDGIRDRVDGPLLSKAFVQRFGCALGGWLQEQSQTVGIRPHVVIGRDTRESGRQIFLWLSQGLYQAGVGVFDAAIVPTPAIARAVIDLDIDAGIMITASHNPAGDNGIKIIVRGGRKMTAAEEETLEARIEASPPLSGDADGTPPVVMYDASRHYMDFARAILPPLYLQGMRIAVDCSNGATVVTTPGVLRRLGAAVSIIGDQPDGRNINDGVGSEHVATLRGRLPDQAYDLILAHDGDGDRMMLVDERGAVVDGDAIMALVGCRWAATGRLKENTVVATIVSNAGLGAALERCDGKLLRTDVGDREVAAQMREAGLNFGGESSGHFIFADDLPTGDGLIAALRVLEVLREMKKPLSECVAECYEPFPQHTRNLRVTARPALASIEGLDQFVAEQESALGPGGRILLRYSGTEPKLRLLVEGRDPDLCAQVIDRLYRFLKKLPLASCPSVS